MKSTFTLLFAIATILSTYAQEPSSTLFLQINKTDNKPVMEDLSCWITDIESGQKINPERQQNGYYKFMVTSGHNYMLHFADIPDYEEISIPGGKTWKMTKTIIYDQRLKTKPKIDIFSLTYDTIYQDHVTTSRPDMQHSIIRISLADKYSRPKANIPVSLVSVEDKKLYKRTTGKSGNADFLVPIGRPYTILLNDAMEYGNVPPIPSGGGMMGMKLEYIEAEVNEKDKNDTITQYLTELEPTTDRVYIHLLLKDNNKNVLEGEDIYFDVAGSSKVYHSTTNEKGIAHFLLPKATRYILNFKYEREVDLLDYKNVAGFKEVDIEYHYAGSKAIEKYYETSERNRDGFFTKFPNTKISKSFAGNKYLKKTPVGYNLEFVNKTPISTPAVGDSKIFIPGPYYTNELICVDEESGKFIWGVDLDETGISSVVYYDGIVFVNTYSCTLYALNAKNGELLWSKWLATIIFSTPAVSGNKVITSYPNDLSAMNPLLHKEGDNFAIICFNAKDGEILWQNWLDNEILTTPVISGGKAFTTTHDGSLYIFKLENGELIKKIKGNFNSPPTIANNKLYISELTDKKEFTRIYDLGSFKLIKSSDGYLHQSKILEAKELSSVQRMNHTGNQVSIYKNLAYKIEGNYVKCFDANSWKEKWKYLINNKNTYDLFANKATSVAPAVFNDMVMASSFSGYIYFLDYETGKLIKKHDLGEPLFSQAIVNKGKLISGTAKGKLITIDTKDTKFDAWPMLNGSSEHNAAKE